MADGIVKPSCANLSGKATLDQEIVHFLKYSYLCKCVLAFLFFGFSVYILWKAHGNNKGHKFISLGYLVFPSLNKGIIYLHLHKTKLEVIIHPNWTLLWLNCDFPKSLGHNSGPIVGMLFGFSVLPPSMLIFTRYVSTTIEWKNVEPCFCLNTALTCLLFFWEVFQGIMTMIVAMNFKWIHYMELVYNVVMSAIRNWFKRTPPPLPGFRGRSLKQKRNI